MHAFYLQERARENFEAIAAETGGQSSFLDISAANASDALLNLMTVKLLSSVDERFAEQYMKTYSRHD